PADIITQHELVRANRVADREARGRFGVPYGHQRHLRARDRAPVRGDDAAADGAAIARRRADAWHARRPRGDDEIDAAVLLAALQRDRLSFFRLHAAGIVDAVAQAAAAAVHDEAAPV